MNKFINDMIHMTEGELLINYWWLWALILVTLCATAYLFERVDKK